jgi:hypothetical protein
MPSRAWPDSARAIIKSALKVRISASDSSMVLSSACRYCDSVAQPGQRRLEIVGDIVGHFLEAVHERLDALQHDVEVAGEPVELVAGPRDREPPGQIAVHDLARRFRHRVDALEHATGHEQTAGHAQHHDDGQ